MKERKPSRLMAVCEICGRGIPDEELMTHQRETHASALAIKEDCQRSSRRAFMVRMIPGILLFPTISLMCVVYLPVQDQYLILLALLPIGVSALWGAVAGENEMAAYKEVLKSTGFSCHRCGMSISRDECPAHFREVHGRTHKWLSGSLCLLLGIPIAAGLSSAFISVRYLSVPIQEAILWGVGAGVVSGMAWALTVEYLILPEIESR